MPAQPKERSAKHSAGGIVINVKCSYRAYLVAQLVKNPPTMQETACNAEDLDSVPGSGISPGGGLGNPLQYPCPESFMGRGA